MKIQESAENYLEAILMIKQRQGQVRSIDIVNELNFTKPSVSVAMKQLGDNGYLNKDSDGYITLTDAGLKIAEDIYERHAVLTKVLIYLGVDEEVAKKDACRIEHAISAEAFACLKEHCKKILE